MFHSLKWYPGYQTSAINSLNVFFAPSVYREETVELPLFEGKISEEESVALGKKFDRASKYLPT